MFIQSVRIILSRDFKTFIDSLNQWHENKYELAAIFKGGLQLLYELICNYLLLFIWNL